MTRTPVVAGQFYPDEPAQLRQTVSDLLSAPRRERPALGLIAPHAGYLYSGRIAGETFAQVSIPRRIVILGPNHHGYGHPAAVYATGSWATPLGTVAVAADLAAALLAESAILEADKAAHRFEHSLEVMLPFIQVLAPEATIVPICLGHLPLNDLLALGESIGDVLAARKEEVLLVASSDMTHYESGDVARQKDMLALQKVLELDPVGLFRTVAARKISMCGVLPVTVLLAACRKLGAGKATLVHYGNSGDVTGDQSQVVGYAGVILERS